MERATSSGAGRPGLAAGMVVGAMALFGLIDNFMRLAAETGGLWQFHLLRGGLALALLWPAAWLMGARLRPVRPGRVLLRTALNASAMVIYFGAAGIMPIAQAVAGLFTAPLWVVLFSVLLFGERVGPRRLAAVGLGFVGVLLALGLRAEEVTPWSALPVLAGALYGMGNLVTRAWCAEEGTLTLLGAFFGALAVVGGVGCLWLAVHPLPVAEGTDGFLARGWVAPTGAFLLVTVAQAVGSLVGVGIAIRGYQIANPTLIAVMENTLLVFATLWAVALWGDVPGPVETLGLVLVTAAGVMIAMQEPRRAAA